ncbi:hypothetical protein GF325_00805 [Candidatus Bathyarchaeota archaeon]|nr:hypothetical protein [Candidatus Bathyarchaeota archaeon]
MEINLMTSIQPIRSKESFSIGDLSDPICIIGMPGVADIGKFAIDQLIGIFQAKKIYDIIFYGYPAGVIVDQSMLSAPKAEIFFWKDDDRKNDIFFITADAQPMNPREIYELSDFLIEFLNGFKMSFYVSLGGYPIKNGKVGNPSIFVTSTSQKYIDRLVEKDLCSTISKGVVIGANGLIPSLANLKYHTEGIVLLAETSNMALMNENMTDLNASLKLIKVLDTLFNLSLNIDFSKKNVDNMNQNLEKKRKELESELDVGKTIASKQEKGKVLYI